MTQSKFDNWTEIDLSAIQHNIRMIEHHAGIPVMAVIKANGYGHGSITVARAALAAGSPFLAVARYHEARELRRHGIDAPVLVLGRVSADEISEAVALQIRATLFDPEQIRLYSDVLADNQQRLLVHAKFDTGMGRLGVGTAEALPLLKAIMDAPTLELEGIYSHLARADELGISVTKEQMERFSSIVQEARQAGICPQQIHLSNSAGAWFYPQLPDCTMVRGGIAIYGLNPSEKTPLPNGFRPALSWKTNIVSIKTVQRGQAISYGGKYIVQKEHERIAVISVGYADGFRRVNGNRVLIDGKKLPVIGTVCMDQCMVPLDDEIQAEVGDEVVLIGRQGDQEISAANVARTWGTINYEVVCGIGQRVKRYYPENGIEL